MSETILKARYIKSSDQYLSPSFDIIKSEQKLASSTLVNSLTSCSTLPPTLQTHHTIAGLQPETFLQETGTLVYPELSKLLQKIRDFMKNFGLSEKEDFQIEVSRWFDYEVDGWSYLQIKVTLVKSGIDRFDILKSLTDLAYQTLPKNVLQETAILVE
ncbi:MAG: hypothetical protein HA495_00090 [Thaumarchaeota archaeon]|jgi:hypothetical protein|nr:hypothetical protein [Nitrososphaerota archaeon]